MQTRFSTSASHLPARGRGAGDPAWNLLARARFPDLEKGSTEPERCELLLPEKLQLPVHLSAEKVPVFLTVSKAELRLIP